MAELLSLVGIGLSAPNVLQLLWEAGIGIQQRVRDVKQYDKDLKKYHKLGEDMSKGIIIAQVRVVIAAFNDRLIPDELKRELDQSFRELIQAIADVNEAVKKSLARPLSGRMQVFFLSKNTKLVNSLDALEQKQCSFDRLSKVVHMFRNSPIPYKLDARNFCVVGERQSGMPGRLLRNSDVFITKGEFSKNDSIESPEIILEPKEYTKVSKRQVEEDVAFLVSRLQLAGYDSGIPKCLGYRQSPYEDHFEMIFQLPANLVPRSLADMLAFDQPLTWEERVSICRMLASAAADVHSFDLVHKNIRPRSILVLTSREENIMKGVLLTDWTLLRDDKQPSTRRGEDEWQRAIYQHPTRHGDVANQRYSFAHDIYSIGVCMLEVLTWQPILVWPVDGDLDADVHFSESFQRRILDIGRAQGIEDRYLTDPSRATFHGQLVFEAINDMASTEIPRIADSQIEGAVLKALSQPRWIEESKNKKPQAQATDTGVEDLRAIIMVFNGSVND